MIGYVRVSTEEQAAGTQRIELDDQRGTIRAEADRRGWEVQWMTDDGYSAADLRRPGI